MENPDFPVISIFLLNIQTDVMKEEIEKKKRLQLISVECS
jgi:hypothetical protein